MNQEQVMQQMQEQEQKAPKSYRTDIISDDVEYEVQENGDVKVIQKQHSEIYWKGGAFTSLMRQNKEALKMFQDAQSKGYLEKMAKQEEEVQKVIDTIQPIVELSEKKQEEDYKKMRHEGLKVNVGKALDDKETKEEWFKNVWIRTKDEIKRPVYAELSAEHQKKLNKILMVLKRKGFK